MLSGDTSPHATLLHTLPSYPKWLDTVKLTAPHLPKCCKLPLSAAVCNPALLNATLSVSSQAANSHATQNPCCNQTQCVGTVQHPPKPPPVTPTPNRWTLAAIHGQHALSTAERKKVCAPEPLLPLFLFSREPRGHTKPTSSNSSTIAAHQCRHHAITHSVLATQEQARDGGPEAKP